MSTTDVTGGKPITVLLQSIPGVSAINPLVAFYDIHGGKKEVLYFYFVLDTTRDTLSYTYNMGISSIHCSHRYNILHIIIFFVGFYNVFFV
jgi:hypothetical protein